MTDDREDRIRQRAHRLWEDAGRPDGADAAHWQQAETEIDAADAPPAVKKAPSRTPRAAPATKPAKPRAAKKA